MSTQLTFAELRRSRATDPQTSQDAARRESSPAAAIVWLVLGAVVFALAALYLVVSR